MFFLHQDGILLSNHKNIIFFIYIDNKILHMLLLLEVQKNVLVLKRLLNPQILFI